MAKTRSLLWVSLAVLLAALGLAVRLYSLTAPPLDFHPTRQFHSLIMARGMFYQNNPAIPPALQDQAVQQWKAEGIIEPPFLENLVAFTYRLTGREVFWAGRLYSMIFWMVGGLGLYLLCRLYLPAPACLVGLGFYLTLPFGVFASRSFQPDPLMTALLIFAWWAFACWMKLHSWKWALFSGLLGGIAVLVKSTSIFLVAPIWAAGVLLDGGLRKALRSGQVWALALLTVAPSLLYMLNGLFGSGQLAGQLSLRFFPSYWIDPAFYLRWYGQLSEVFSLPWLILALLGLVFLPNRQSRIIGWGAWAGYLLMGFALSHHISTHSYYHLPLLPVAGLSLAALAQAGFSALPEPRRLLALLAGLILVGGAFFSAWDARTAIKHANQPDEPAFWQEMADKMGQNASVVGITPDYGYRLEYWGWITPSNWLSSNEQTLRESAGQIIDFSKTFKEMTANKQYFLITQLDELDRQPELKAYLEKNYALFASGPGWVIYNLLPASQER